MELHHDKHHQTYITNLNKALQVSAKAQSEGKLQDAAAQLSAIRFNGGGHINHSLFWEGLAPSSSPDSKLDAAPKLASAIKSTWGSFDKFKEVFGTALLGIQGSGWGVSTSHACLSPFYLPFMVKTNSCYYSGSSRKPSPDSSESSPWPTRKLSSWATPLSSA